MKLLLDITEVAEALGWSTRTIERRLVAGKFPQPTKGFRRGEKRLWHVSLIEREAKRNEKSQRKVCAYCGR